MRLLGFLLLCSNLICFGQEVIPLTELQASKPISQYIVDHWDTEDGLPNNAILDIAKTSDGFKWLATFNGLVRFDGKEFKIYDKSNTPELGTNNIASLLTDSEDRLWIGTNGGGLIKYHHEKFTFYNTDSLLNSSIVTTLEEGPEGSVWVGTRFGLASLKNDSLSRIKHNELAFGSITALFSDDRGRLWVGTTSEGLYVLEGGSLLNFSVQHGLPSNFIRAVFSDSRGRIWVGTDKGVALIDASGVIRMDSLNNAPLVFTNTFIEDNSGNVWLGSNDGIRRFNGAFETLSWEQGLSHNIVQTLFQDDEGNIWAGTYRGGLNRLKEGKFFNLGVPEGLSNDVINVTYEDDSILWIGSDEGLIGLKEGNLSTFQVGGRSAGNRIRDILRDSQGRLWLCTYQGLVQFEDGKVVRRFTESQGLSSDNTRRIVEDNQGALWIGTANGLNRFKDGKFQIFGVKSGLRDQFVMSLLVDRNNQLWVGTDGGGIYQFREDRFENVLSPHVTNDIIFNLLQDQEGAIWISTNRGVIYVNDTLEFNISKQHGLPSNSIFQVLLDNQGQVWFTSDLGLMKTSLIEIRNLVLGITSELLEYRIFDHSDGLRSTAVTAASIATKTSDGKIWFPTLKGITIVDNDQIPVNLVLAKTSITLMIADGNEYALNNAISLPAGSRRLEFHYTGLSFYAPEKVRYKYKLVNFDDHWVDASDRRTAYYTNVPPGSYEFQVIAANNDGFWNMEPAIVKFVQKAYFYQTPYFYLLIGIFLILLGAFLYYLRAIELKRRNLELTALVQERTRDIQSQNEAIIAQREELKQLNTVKDKLLSVISHDLRGPIAAVAGLLGLLKSGHLNHKELVTQSNSLNNEVHGLTYLLDNLLSWSKTQMQGIRLNKENVQMKKVVEDNLRIIRPMSDHKEITILNLVQQHCYVYTDVNFLSLLIRNLIMNAIKFTHKGGEIKILSEDQGEHVQITVNDTGVGIGEQDLARLFNTQSHYSKMGTANEAGTGIGLLLCKEFMEIDGGKIWAESEKGKGSSFKFVLSKGKRSAQAMTS